MRLDVFLDTGVTVTVSDEMDLDSDDAINQIKHLARTKFIDLLNTGFDIQFERVEDQP
jgi:hypothetical protein